MSIYVKTFTGKLIDIEGFKPENIDLRDIAFSLSRQRRYAGHTSTPWTVGQHMVLCSMIGSMLNLQPKYQLAVFIHDIHETWTQDIINPIKRNFTLSAYDDLQSDIDKVVYEFFGIKDVLDDKEAMDFVKLIDTVAYFMEYHRLMMFAEDNHFPEFNKDFWDIIKFLEDKKFTIPKDLILYNDDDIAQNIFEILTVAHTEGKLGSEISSKGAFVKKG